MVRWAIADAEYLAFATANGFKGSLYYIFFSLFIFVSDLYFNFNYPKIKMITRSQKNSRKPINSHSDHQTSISKHCRVVVEKLDIEKYRLPSTSNTNQKLQCKVVLKDVLKDPNTSHKIFSKCDFSRCQLKSHFLPTDDFKSSCTTRKYKCVIPRGCHKITCHSSNVIYLLTCSTCGLQYVGETAQQLNARFNGHRLGMKNPKKYGTCKILSNHFDKGVCKDSDYTVQVIEKLEGSGRTERHSIDPKITSKRRKREDFWMKTLRTVYP